MTVWNPVSAAHLSAVTAWVGGMFYALAVPRPSVAVLEPPRRMAPHVRAFRRSPHAEAVDASFFEVVTALGGLLFAEAGWRLP